MLSLEDVVSTGAPKPSPVIQTFSSLLIFMRSNVYCYDWHLIQASNIPAARWNGSDVFASDFPAASFRGW